MGYKYAKSNLVQEVLDTEGHWGNNAIDGFRSKKFRLFDCEFFSELIHELKTDPDCKYETMVNDLIKSGYTPKWIYALDKKPYSQDMAILEVIASRFLNAMKCPTTYETIVESDVVNYLNEKISSEKRVLSVDFMKGDKEYYNLTGFDYCFMGSSFSHLEDGLKYVLYEIYKYKYIKSDKFKKVDIDEVLNDFVYSYLIRVFILEDRDFKACNCGLVIDPKNDRLNYACNFDFEYILNDKLTHEKIFKNDKSQEDKSKKVLLEYIAKKYPRAFDRFIENLNRLKSTNKNITYLENVFSKIKPQDQGEEKVYNKAKSFIKNNIDSILNMTASFDKGNDIEGVAII